MDPFKAFDRLPIGDPSKVRCDTERISLKNMFHWKKKIFKLWEDLREGK